MRLKLRLLQVAHAMVQVLQVIAASASSAQDVSGALIGLNPLLEVSWLLQHCSKGIVAKSRLGLGICRSPSLTQQ